MKGFRMNSNRRDYRLTIAIPSSLVSEVPHLREQTSVIGRVARIAAIHRVEDIYVYRDSPDESRLIQLILTYIETPQYLRAFVLQDPPEMEWIRGMQEVFFIIFLAGLGVWAVSEFFRAFWKPNEEAVIA